MKEHPRTQTHITCMWMVHLSA